MIEMFKECNNCKKKLPNELFRKHKKHSTCYNWCVKCEILYKKQRHREINKKYRENNKENKNNSNNKWRNKNKEKFLKNQRDYRHKNRIKIYNHKKYREETDFIYRTKILLRTNLNVHLKRCLINKQYSLELDEQTFNHLKSFFNKPCEICKNLIITETPKNYHIDHIIPLGIATNFEDLMKLNWYQNLRLLCITCNLKKSSKDKKLIKNLRKAEKILQKTIN